MTPPALPEISEPNRTIPEHNRTEHMENNQNPTTQPHDPARTMRRNSLTNKMLYN